MKKVKVITIDFSKNGGSAGRRVKIVYLTDYIATLSIIFIMGVLTGLAWAYVQGQL